MTDRSITISSILNDAVDLVRRNASPWAALTVLAALPFRFLQVEYAERLVMLGAQARHYRNALLQTATLAIAAYVVLLVARLVFARACRMTEGGERATGWAPLKPALASIALYLGIGLALQALSVVVAATIVAIPVIAIFSGIAAVTSDQSEKDPSLGGALRRLGRYTSRPATLIGLMLVLSAAFVILAANLFFAFSLLLWMAGGLAGMDVTHWSTLFTLRSRVFDLLVAAGAAALLEPFWIAVCVAFVRQSDAIRTGADLRGWLNELAARDAEKAAGGQS